jgi:hypothetical protein
MNQISTSTNKTGGSGGGLPSESDNDGKLIVNLTIAERETIIK